MSLESREHEYHSLEGDEDGRSDMGMEETLDDFLDPNRNLNGRIGPFKINFNKNLKRFQDLAL